MKIDLIPIGDVIPYDNNPRKNDKAVEIVKKSIKEFGFKVPLIIDKNNSIVAGHTRLKAALELGLKIYDPREFYPLKKDIKDLLSDLD